MTIGQAIKKRIDESGMTIRQVAIKAGISPETIYQWIVGGDYPNVFPLICIADVLEVSLDELVGRTQYNNPCAHCGFYPPSSCDGKPCLLCPAQVKEKI